MRRLNRWLHLWLSVPFGIVFSIICLTGAILVFEKEITQAVRSAEPVSESIQKEHDRKPKALPFFRTVKTIHKYVLIPPKAKGEMSAGKMIVGITTLVSVVILITGVIWWLPRSRKGLKGRLRVEARKGWRRFWHDTHVSLGFYSALFLIIMCLTGLTWSFSWSRSLIYGLLGEDVRTERVESRPAPVSASSKTAIEEMSKPKEASASKAGEKKQKHKSKARRIVKEWHVGTWGGYFSKILWFISALIGGTLPLTGYYLWYKRLKRSR